MEEINFLEIKRSISINLLQINVKFLLKVNSNRVESITLRK